MRLARRVRRAAPLPNSVRICAMSLASSATGTPNVCETTAAEATARKGATWLHRVDHGAGWPASLAEATQRSYLTAPSLTQPGGGRGGVVCLLFLRAAQLLGVVQELPSKRLVTEPSSNTARIARASSGAMGSTVSCGKTFSPPMGKVSVTTISRAPHAESRR